MKCFQQLQVVDSALSRFFGRLGHCIGGSPGYFIVIPVLISTIAITGFQRLHQERLPENLFSLRNGDSQIALQLNEKYFPVNFNNFSRARRNHVDHVVRIMATPRDGGSILREAPLKELQELDDIIQAVQFKNGDRSWNYTSLCARWKGQCIPNEVLRLARVADRLENGNISLDYPVWLDDHFKPLILIEALGALEVNDENLVTYSPASILIYFTAEEKIFGTDVSLLWENEVLKVLKRVQHDLKHVDIGFYLSRTLSDELEHNLLSVLPYMILNYLMMGVLCVIMCLSRDWVRAKPIVVLLGVLGACLATGAAFGVLMYCGATFNILNMAAPFLALAIGVDDTFVVLAAWRRTRIQDPVPQRMAQTYRESAVSITITSLTDMFSFWVGVATPIPSVQTFCLYTGLSVVFTYIWHVTFFGGCLAVAGYAEQRNLHSVFFKPVLPRSESGEKSRLYQLFCAGGVSHAEPWREEDNRPHAMMLFFKNSLAKWLNMPKVKALVLAVFVVYMSCAIWGCSQVEEGLKKENLVAKDSYAAKFFQMSAKYFYNNPYRIQVTIEGNHDYFNPAVQERMENLTQALETSQYVDEFYTETWLRDWDTLSYILSLDVSTRAQWMTELKTNLLHPESKYHLDVVFDHTGDEFQAIRFLIQAKDMRSTRDESAMLQELSNICEESEFKCHIFNPVFVMLDQYTYVRTITIQSTAAASIIMCIISLIFIPHPACSIWVALSIFSIEVGVIGYMSLWGVNLDSISMINLIMCIGFSVDFSAHVSYAYMTSKGDAKERVEQCLYAVGLPILQGGISTIVGTFSLMLTEAYIFEVFFKTTLLVISLGLLHGLFLLPVLLSLLGPGSTLFQLSSKSEDKSDDVGSESASGAELDTQKQNGTMLDLYIVPTKAMPETNGVTGLAKTTTENGAANGARVLSLSQNIPPESSHTGSQEGSTVINGVTRSDQNFRNGITPYSNGGFIKEAVNDDVAQEEDMIDHL